MVSRYRLTRCPWSSDPDEGALVTDWTTRSWSSPCLTSSLYVAVPDPASRRCHTGLGCVRAAVHRRLGDLGGLPDPEHEASVAQAPSIHRGLEEGQRTGHPLQRPEVHGQRVERPPVDGHDAPSLAEQR